MKRFKIILILLFLFRKDASAQDAWDSLISRIRNGQLTIECYNTQATLSTLSDDVHILVAAGKKITPRIVPLLGDEQKGIVAHYILTRIWKERKFKPARNYAENTHVTVIDFHKLTFRMKSSDEVIAAKADLEANKERWLTFLPKVYH